MATASLVGAAAAAQTLNAISSYSVDFWSISPAAPQQPPS